MKKENHKKFLEDTKKQVADINFYLSNVKIVDKDRRSLINHSHAIVTAQNLMRSIGDELWDMEKELREDKASRTDDNYKQILASINSPTEQMIKSSESNMAIRNGNNSLNLIKQAVEMMKKKAVQNGSDLHKKANRKN
jgi:hypothetical protein